jgi:hypothetical protein
VMPGRGGALPFELGYLFEPQEMGCVGIQKY